MRLKNFNLDIESDLNNIKSEKAYEEIIFSKRDFICGCYILGENNSKESYLGIQESLIVLVDYVVKNFKILIDDSEYDVAYKVVGVIRRRLRELVLDYDSELKYFGSQFSLFLINDNKFLSISLGEILWVEFINEEYFFKINSNGKNNKQFSTDIEVYEYVKVVNGDISELIAKF